MKRLVAVPNYVPHTDVGHYLILPRDVNATRFGALSTRGLGTCVAILIKTDARIGLAHSDTFKVVNDARTLLNALSVEDGATLSITLAYNAFYKQLGNAMAWNDGLKNLALNRKFNLNLKFHAVATSFEIVGITLYGDCFSLSTRQYLDGMVNDGNPRIWKLKEREYLMVNRTIDYLLGPKLRSYSTEPTRRGPMNSPHFLPKMAEFNSPQVAENALDSRLHEWVRYIPYNLEAMADIHIGILRALLLFIVFQVLHLVLRQGLHRVLTVSQMPNSDNLMKST